MSSLYVTDYLKRLHISTLRELFALDMDFPYNKIDISKSSVLINSKYTEPSDLENRMPQIIVSATSYSSATDLLANNFYEEVAPNQVKNDAIVTKRFTKLVTYQLKADILSPVKAECERLTDKVFNIFNHECVGLWDALKVNIRQVSAGEAGPRSQYPQYSFTSPIFVQGDFRFIWTMGVPINPTPNLNQAHILRNIQVAIEATDDI